MMFRRSDELDLKTEMTFSYLPSLLYPSERILDSKKLIGVGLILNGSFVLAVH